MTHRPTRSTGVLFLATCLVLGCSNSSTLGCGRSSEEEPSVDAKPADAPQPTAAPEKVTHESKLVGIYKITTFQHSETTCDQLTDAEPRPVYLVMYGFRPSANPQEVRLGGTFCSDVNLCRALARQAPEPTMGYSFISGDDEAGWQGWAITGTAPEEDQCTADVQSHSLSRKDAKTIHIETKTVHTVFPPVVEGKNATCHNRAALDAVSDDLPCKALFVLDATFEAAL